MNSNTILRNLIFTGIFIIPFIPFFVSQSMLFPFITGKNFAFRIIVEIIFALWVLLAIRHADYRPRFSWLLVAFASFAFIVGVADIFAVNSYKAFWSNYERMEGFITIFHLFLYFLVLSSMLHIKKWWDYLLGTWLASSVFMCLYGLFQLSGKITINQGGVRVDGTLGNATYLAVFLLFTIFFGIFLFVRSSKESQKKFVWIFAPVLLLELVILYYTATRGAILGLIGGAGEDVESILALVDDGVEGAADELEFLADADGVWVLDLVDALDQQPIDGELLGLADAGEAVAGFDDVGRGEAVFGGDPGGEEEVFVDGGEFLAEGLLIGG